MGYKVASFEWGSIDPNEVIKKHESKTKSSSQYHISVGLSFNKKIKCNLFKKINMN